MLLFDIFSTCITKASIGVISTLLLCHFSENFGAFILFFVFTYVSKIQDELSPALERFFVDVVDGLAQFGDGFGGISKRGAFIDRDRKLCRAVNDMILCGLKEWAWNGASKVQKYWSVFAHRCELDFAFLEL